MDIEAKKDELKIAVGENLGQGLQEIRTALNPKSKAITEVLTQQGRYKDNERKQRGKVISHNDYTRETNQIRLAALNLIGMYGRGIPIASFTCGKKTEMNSWHV